MYTHQPLPKQILQQQQKRRTYTFHFLPTLPQCHEGEIKVYAYTALRKSTGAFKNTNAETFAPVDTAVKGISISSGYRVPLNLVCLLL